uniref:BAC19.1 n=1 Tax=Solanum lycopersicum TaxID=4081 RepID=Q9FYX5_SOLLC|nr:BAC19.1 [Solanum lycopersicum]
MISTVKTPALHCRLPLLAVSCQRSATFDLDDSPISLFESFRTFI